MTDYTVLGMTFLMTLIYSLSGIVQAKQNGENFDIVSFVKTLLLNFAGVGLISQANLPTYNLYVQAGFALVGSTVIMYIDRVVNKFLGRLPNLPSTPPAPAKTSASTRPT